MQQIDAIKLALELAAGCLDMPHMLPDYLASSIRCE